jgi:ketosteroid isomerase-like protein
MLSNRPQVKLDVRKITPSGGDLALVIVDWTEWTPNTMSSAGEAKQWAGTATDIVRKQPDGRWKLALDIPYGIE